MTSQIVLSPASSSHEIDGMCMGVVYTDPVHGPMDAYTTPKTVWPIEGKRDSAFLIPYWIVRDTPNQDEANMELTQVVAGPLKLPMIQNTKAIEPDEELLWFKRAKIAKRAAPPAANTVEKKAKSKDNTKGKGNHGKGKGKGETD